MAAGSNEAGAAAMTSGRRYAIGANVAAAIAAAAALLVAVNWISSLKYVRKDLAMAGNYGLSDRTKSILRDCPDEIQLSILYEPNPQDDQQQETLSRLQDYCDELRRFAPSIQVTHVATDAQREKLVARISSTSGGEADKHKEALASFERLRGQLAADLEQRLAEAAALMSQDSWLGDFPLFASIAAALREDGGALEEAANEIAELTPAGGIPKYAAATDKAKSILTDVQGHFKTIAERLGELADLSAETAKPDSQYIVTLREAAAEARALVASLRATVGDQEAPMPDDPAAALKLKAFADRGTEVGNGLDALVQRVNAFARQFPMVTQHPNWSAQVKSGPFMMRLEVAGVLRQAGETLRSARLMILGVIDTGNPDELQKVLLNTRRQVAVLEQNASVCEELLTGLAGRLSSVDPSSKALLDAVRGGGFLADRIKAIEKLVKQIDELPELKLGSVADELKQDNTVVVEIGGKVRVVSFDEVFPVRQSVGGQRRTDDFVARSFNGDSALSSAILALARDHPFATVVLVAFEPPAPPRQGRFSPPPPRSRIPSTELTELRKRLTASNFEVVDWNLATTKKPPEPKEGTENVYVLLPPAPPNPPNPFGGQTPPDQVFGESQRAIIRGLLEKDARMLFLATWEVRGGGLFGGPPTTPPYGYAPLLDQDWGIRVGNDRRIVWVEPDLRRADSFMVVPRRFIHMPAAYFSDHAIGEPLRGTRFLITDACPIELKPEQPEGVTVEAVLRIPRKENYICVGLSDLIRIIDEVNNPKSEGVVTLRPPPTRGEFDVMLTAERHAGEEGKGKIVVMGFAASVWDGFLMNPVWAAGERLRLDPAPTENADLFANALYWLQGQTQWIASGPVPVPRVASIPPGEMQAVRAFVWGVWPALVFAPCLLLWYVRRR